MMLPFVLKEYVFATARSSYCMCAGGQNVRPTDCNARKTYLTHKAYAHTAQTFAVFFCFFFCVII